MNIMKDNFLEKTLPLQTSSDFKQFQVYEEIKQDILNNTYPAGTIMVERKLCDIYNVSRSPIRNALQKLSYEGLLTFVPGKGVIVPEFSIEDILEVYDLIELLQSFAITTCISRLNDVALETLEDILDKMKAARQQGNIALATEWDQKFHKYIITFSGNKRLVDVFENLHNQSMRFQASTLDDQNLAEKSYNEHLQLYQCIKDKDVAKAKNAIKTHYHNVKQHYINMLILR